MRKIKFLGISDGQVGSAKCGDCEHCSMLRKGTPWFDTDGVTWCEDCLLSGEYTEEELKKVKNSKTWVVFPNQSEMLWNLFFTNGYSLEVFQTYQVKKKESVVSHIEFKLFDKRSKEIASKIVGNDNQIAEFNQLVESNKLIVDEKEFKSRYSLSEDPEASLEKSEKNLLLFNLVFKKIYGDELLQAETKKNTKLQLQSLTFGIGKVNDLQVLSQFLPYHFEKISQGWPSFARERIKKWDNIFSTKKKSVVLNMDKHSLMWGTYTDNGSVDEDFIDECGDSYQWEEEVYWLADLLEKKEDNCFNRFFEKIGVQVSITDSTVSFSLSE